MIKNTILATLLLSNSLLFCRPLPNDNNMLNPHNMPAYIEERLYGLFDARRGESQATDNFIQRIKSNVIDTCNRTCAEIWMFGLWATFDFNCVTKATDEIAAESIAQEARIIGRTFTDKKETLDFIKNTISDKAQQELKKRKELNGAFKKFHGEALTKEVWNAKNEHDELSRFANQ